jgi:hypothetical protein
VAVDAEPGGGIAPPATCVQECRQGLDERCVLGDRAEDAVDERLQRRARQAEQELE